MNTCYALFLFRFANPEDIEDIKSEMAYSIEHPLITKTEIGDHEQYANEEVQFAVDIKLTINAENSNEVFETLFDELEYDFTHELFTEEVDLLIVNGDSL